VREIAGRRGMMERETHTSKKNKRRKEKRISQSVS
jgi:hypothetical protein